MKNLIAATVVALSSFAYSFQPVATAAPCPCTQCACVVCVDCLDCCEDCESE